MAAKASEVMIANIGRAQDEEMQHAIDNFMRALQTYPERAAFEPGLSFEQHFFQVAAEDLQPLSQQVRVH